jgi:hypothetical protein
VWVEGVLISKFHAFPTEHLKTFQAVTGVTTLPRFGAKGSESKSQLGKLKRKLIAPL